MAHPRVVMPLAVLAISVSGLLSINCGLVTPPLTHSLIAENHRQRFDINIVDSGGQPLTDVTVTLIKTYTRWDLMNGEGSSSIVEVLHPAKANPLSVDRFAYSEIFVFVDKPGYKSCWFYFRDDALGGDIAVARSVEKGIPRGTVMLRPSNPPTDLP